MAVDISLFSQLVSKPAMLAVLKEILKNRFGAGWAVAKSLNQNPKETEEALGELKSLGLLDTDTNSSGLDGVYYPTSMGLSLSEDLNVR